MCGRIYFHPEKCRLPYDPPGLLPPQAAILLPYWQGFAQSPAELLRIVPIAGLSSSAVPQLGYHKESDVFATSSPVKSEGWSHSSEVRSWPWPRRGVGSAKKPCHQPQRPVRKALCLHCVLSYKTPRAFPGFLVSMPRLLPSEKHEGVPAATRPFQSTLPHSSWFVLGLTGRFPSSVFARRRKMETRSLCVALGCACMGKQPARSVAMDR